MSHFVVGVDGKKITPEKVTEICRDENDGKPLVAMFGRWYDAKRLEITTYEDELPEDITDDEYALWFSVSVVDGVRIGPSIDAIRGMM